MEETIHHLFWDCRFALSCWDAICQGKRRGFSVLEESVLAMQSLPKYIAMDIVILGCWNIWMQRNGKIFNDIRPSLNSWRHMLKHDL